MRCNAALIDNRVRCVTNLLHSLRKHNRGIALKVVSRGSCCELISRVHRSQIKDLRRYTTILQNFGRSSLAHSSVDLGL